MVCISVHLGDGGGVDIWLRGMMIWVVCISMQCGSRGNADGVVCLHLQFRCWSQISQESREMKNCIYTTIKSSHWFDYESMVTCSGFASICVRFVFDNL